MRFALVGNQPDGLEMTTALLDSGRHQLLYWSASSLSADYLRRLPASAQRINDLEEVLADPAVEMILVASSPANRPAHLRRAIQSERHVLCIHPADDRPALAYEAAMMQKDTGYILLPLLGEGLHPGVVRLRQLIADKESPLGEFRVVEMERWATEEVLLNTANVEQKLCFPGWDALRALGGDIAEVSGFAHGEEVTAGLPVVLVGRFEEQGLFQMSLLPGQREERRRIRVVGRRGQAELQFPAGFPGPAFLTWRTEQGQLHEEFWEVWSPWPALVEVLDAHVGDSNFQGRLSWQDEVRALELDDAGRRSVEKRRTALLEYPEASEEATFKGTMTLVGCSILWAIILLVILSRWFPMLGWAVGPVLGLFLLLQLLRWLIPAPPPAPRERDASGGNT